MGGSVSYGFPLRNMGRHLTRPELEAGLEAIRQAPADRGTLALIVGRPAPGERQALEEGTLDTGTGLVGDSWHSRPRPRWMAADAHADTQLTVMNARVVALVAGDRSRWPLAGDQLYVDLDLSTANLPPGTQLAIGDAVIEVTPQPHTGCGKFVSRFGVEAMKFVNSPLGRELNLRGINARIVRPGRVRVGDVVIKLAIAAPEPVQAAL